MKFGAQLNAYTSIDETVYNIDNVPVAKYPTSIDSCLLILHDWAGSLLLEDEEIDKERGVIHEEWRSRQNAQMRLYDKILPVVYPGNKYGERMPIGLMSVVDNFPYEALRSYYHTWYRPDQQGIVVVGDFDVDAVEEKVKQIFSTLPAAPADAPERVYTPIEDNVEPIIATATDKEQSYGQSYIFLKHPAIPFEAKYTMDYLLVSYVNDIIGSMADARLSEMSQAADPDFIYAGMGDSDFMLSKTCGSFLGVAVYDETQMLRSLNSIYREMLRVIRNGFTASEYERARADYLSSLESSYNQRDKKSSASYCSELVRNFIDNEPIPGIETEFAIMSQLAPNIPVEVINQFIAEEYNVEGNMVVINMLPEKEGLVYPTDEEILASLKGVEEEEISPYEDKVVDQPLVSKLRKAGKVKKSEDAEFGYKHYVLSNGANVYFKSTDLNKDQVLVKAYSYGGKSLYPESDYVTLSVVDDLIEIGGLGEFSATELSKALAGKKVSISPFVGSTEEGYNASSTPKDLETLFQLSYLYFTSLRSDEEAFTSWKTKNAAALANAESQPMSAFSDSLSHIMYTNPLRAYSLKHADLDKVDYAKALKIARERFANAGDFTFIITGNVSEEQILPLLKTYVASLPSKGKKESYNKVIDFAEGIHTCEFRKQMQDPMVLNFFCYTTPSAYTLKNVLVDELLGSTLEYVLHDEIREKEGGTYGISSSASISAAPIEKGLLQIVYQTDPARYEKLNAKVFEIVKQFVVDGPKAEDLTKAKEALVKDYEEDIHQTSYWHSRMNEYLHYGVDSYTDYLAVLDSVSAEDIKARLAEFLESNNLTSIIMVGAE